MRASFAFSRLYVVVLLLFAGCASASSQAPGATPASYNCWETAMVVKVVDGDTIELDSGERVRYLGIDTPETVHPEEPVQCFGPEAAQRNRELVEGHVVELLRDGEDRDKYGRLLRYVFVGGTFVNAELVRDGYAFARSYGDEPRLYQVLVQLEKDARDGRRGLWASCPQQTSSRQRANGPATFNLTYMAKVSRATSGR